MTEENKHDENYIEEKKQPKEDDLDYEFRNKLKERLKALEELAEQAQKLNMGY